MGLFSRKYHHLNHIQINEQALQQNYQFFLSHSKCLLAPVLKSNAYGHGVVNVANFIDKQLKPPFMAVDSLYEAYQLQKVGIKTKLLLLGYTDPRNISRLNPHQVHLPLLSLEHLEPLAQALPHAHLHINIDSGMHRYGLSLAEIPHLIEKLTEYPHITISGLYSHLASADTPSGKSYTHNQLQIFKQALSLFRAAGINPTWRHLQATAGSLRFQDDDLNLIRLGLGFYGYSPFPTQTKMHQYILKNIKPALSMYSTLTQVKTVGEGSAISYGGTFITPSEMTIGIIPIGYHEGLPGGLSNQGSVFIQDKRCPIIGRVCMNLTILDISAISNPRVGERVEVISPNIIASNSIYHMAKCTNTIPYEILVGLDPSTHRKMLPVSNE